MTRRYFTLIAIALATAIAANAWWFDYSDFTAHAVIASLIAAFAFHFGKRATIAASIWLGLVALSSLAFPLPAPDVHVGTPVSVAVEQLGTPVLRASVAELYSRRNWGYSLPNPARIAHATDVLVYYRPGGVTYVFTKDGYVVAASNQGS